MFDFVQILLNRNQRIHKAKQRELQPATDHAHDEDREFKAAQSWC